MFLAKECELDTIKSYFFKLKSFTANGNRKISVGNGKKIDSINDIVLR